jgi:GT2 family glycosyltransferase
MEIASRDIAAFGCKEWISDVLSLIVCTYQRPKEVHRLLQAISILDGQPDETIIVDGSDDYETQGVVDEIFGKSNISKLQYVRVPQEERGLTRQRNFGITRANGDMIAFLDDDTIPNKDYFSQILACFERHPDAIGVGGFITNEVHWQLKDVEHRAGISFFQFGNWVRREDFRWRLRRILGLDSPLPPGWMPPFSHGRSVGFLPPDGDDYQVELIMGGASTWRRSVFEEIEFSSYFDGYGLYEDSEFCLRASRLGPMFLSTSAKLEHHHASSGRPAHFRYGEMVVRNGWYVWRQSNPNPIWSDRMRWWVITILLTLARLSDVFRCKRGALSESLGRSAGMLSLSWDKPKNV